MELQGERAKHLQSRKTQILISFMWEKIFASYNPNNTTTSERPEGPLKHLQQDIERHGILISEGLEKDILKTMGGQNL